MSQNVITIRPKVLIKMLEEQFPDQNISGTFLMPPSYIGSLTLLESAMLLAFVKLVKPQNVFEFGTFMGHTSVFLAKNIEPSALVYTLDIPENEVSSEVFNTKAEQVDNLLREQSVTTKAKCIDNESEEVQAKINRILCNSLDYDTESLKSSVGLVFVDGGHETHIVSSDTEKAIDMLTEQGVIIWHDYNSDVFTDVTDYVNNFAKNQTIFHIAHTNIAFMWKAQESLIIDTHNSFS